MENFFFSFYHKSHFLSTIVFLENTDLDFFQDTDVGLLASIFYGVNPDGDPAFRNSLSPLFLLFLLFHLALPVLDSQDIP